MLLRAPKDVPWKIGPFLIVNVARSRDTGVCENFCCSVGIIALPLLSRTVARVRREVVDASLEACTGLTNRVNIIVLVFLGN